MVRVSSTYDAGRISKCISYIEDAGKRSKGMEDMDLML